MSKPIHSLEISFLKGENLSEINQRLQEATDEENRLAQLLTDADSGTTPELQAVQQLRNELFDEILSKVNNYEELFYLRGYSFISAYFNKDEMYNIPLEIELQKAIQFIADCNLVLEHPELGETILPLIERFEVPTYVEDTSEFADESGLKPVYYNEEYIAHVQTAKEKFTELIGNNDWTKNAFYLEFIH